MKTLTQLIDAAVKSNAVHACWKDSDGKRHFLTISRVAVLSAAINSDNRKWS